MTATRADRIEAAARGLLDVLTDDALEGEALHRMLESAAAGLAEALDPSLKQCPQCERLLDRSEFNRNRASHDGLQGWCRDCQSRRERELKRARAERREPLAEPDATEPEQTAPPPKPPPPVKPRAAKPPPDSKPPRAVEKPSAGTVDLAIRDVPPGPEPIVVQTVCDAGCRMATVGFDTTGTPDVTAAVAVRVEAALHEASGCDGRVTGRWQPALEPSPPVELREANG